MRKKIYGWLTVIALLVSAACGTGTEVPTEAGVQETVSENDDGTEVPQDTAALEEENEEMKQKYQEAIAQYEAGLQPAEVVPICGDMFEFEVFDMVKSVESIGTDSGREFWVIHFENEANDVLIPVYGDDDTDSDEVRSICNELYWNLKQKTRWMTDDAKPKGFRLPEAGENYRVKKSTLVAEVIDKEIVYNDKHLYEIVSEGGLKNLIAVPVGHIPDSKYQEVQGGYYDGYLHTDEWGTRVMGSYFNPTFNLYFEKAGYNRYYNFSIFGNDFIERHECGMFAVEDNDGKVLVWEAYFYMNIYEFIDNPLWEEEDVWDFLKEQASDLTKDEEVMYELGGINYNRAKVKDNVFLYRFEENKIYTIYFIGIDYDKLDEIKLLITGSDKPEGGTPESESSGS